MFLLYISLSCCMFGLACVLFVSFAMII